jgi:hypothetical protein
MEYIWLSGTKEEIAEMEEAFRRPPAVPTPQPRPWDAVLGGKN